MSQDQLGLFDTPPDRGQIRAGLIIVGLLFVAFILILPVRDLRLGEVDAFIPMIDAIMFLGEVITATLLYAQASVFRSRALIALATGYVFAALLLIPHALTFPGAFAPDGLLGAGINTTGWLANFRRAAFPVTVIAYLLLKRADSAARSGPKRPEIGIIVGVFAAIVLAAALTMLATSGHALLPPFFVNRSDVIYSYGVRNESVTFALFIVAAVMLYRRRTSVLDLWLLVALSGWLIESLLIMALQSRFTAGWYCLYVVTLVAHLIVMLALIAESNLLYARLALSVMAQKREREARLMSMDAVAAAIAHEIRQPLAAMVANASAALRWLDRTPLDPAPIARSAEAIINDGHRTSDVIEGIRSSLARQSGQRSMFSLNDLVRETTSLLGRELAGERVSLRLALDEALPPVLADRVQVQQVLVNLFTNAIESLGATESGPRRLEIRSAPMDGQDVLLEVSDSGVGIRPDQMPRIFDAFFTTKAKGTGLGLSLSRTIAEDHGGRLWASQGEEHGATFHLQLPRSGLPHHESHEP